MHVNRGRYNNFKQKHWNVKHLDEGPCPDKEEVQLQDDEASPLKYRANNEDNWHVLNSNTTKLHIQKLK